VVYIGTGDINATLAEIEKHGGKTISPKTEIPGMGWFALFSDPGGNLVGIYTGMQAQYSDSIIRPLLLQATRRPSHLRVAALT